MKPGIFLTAEWRHLILLNYAVDPALLEPYLPPGLDLDFWNGKAYISLVAFFFEHTRMCGLSIPFHRHFPEVNLRFYVKRRMPHGERRGVVFVREIAPHRAVAYVARRFYGEKYLALPLRAVVEPDARFKDIDRGGRFEWRLGTEEYALAATSEALPRYPEPGSLEEFIIEHYWAYSVGARGDAACLEYEVEHSPWMIRAASTANFKGDAVQLYGSEFAQILARPPDSAFLANGSVVAVRRGTTLARLRRVLPRANELAANACQ